MNHRLRARRAVERGIPTPAILRVSHTELNKLVEAVAEELRMCEHAARSQAFRDAANVAADFVAPELRRRLVDELLNLK